MRSESSAPPEPAPASGRAASAVSFLLAHGTDTHRDSRRIAVGLAVLAVLSVVVLNFGIYQAAQSRLVRERWEQLTAGTDSKREELRGVLRQFESEARFVVEQPDLRGRIAALDSGRELPPEGRARLRAELDRAARTFGFHAVQIVDADGRQLATNGRPSPEEAVRHAALARHAAVVGSFELGDIVREDDGEQVLVMALPIVLEGRVRPAVAVFEAGINDVLMPVLQKWPGFGASAGAYVVRKQGGRVEFVTAPPGGTGFATGDHVPVGLAVVRAAAMAVEGVESRVEMSDRRGRRQAAVTRYLPEVDWGLVGQMEQRAMMAGMSSTLIGLLVLDLAMLVLGVASFWFWRRQYSTGLARREMEVTRRHAERVQAIFDTAFDAILTFDSGGRVRTVNRAAQALFGRDAAGMEGQAIHRFLHWGREGKPTADLPAPGTVSRSEALRADGTVLPVEFTLGSSGEGEDLLFTAIVRDISERVEAERQIESFAEGLEISNRRLEELNAQLEEASRLKSEFLANTSHELRTPLNGMIGFLQLVLDGLCDSPEEERDFLKQALQCSRHLLGLINDVLDIAKIEAGKLSLEIASVDVSQLFDEVYTVTHVQAAQKGIELRFQPPEDRALTVRGDFGKIKQILINLVGNSLKFTPKGSITVRATAKADLGHYMFEIVDTGIGIPADRQKLIFEKFTQGDGSTTRKYGGTGLGLAITRSLVELMGGIIGVQSDGEGRGTRMYFSLPVWNSSDEEAPADDGATDRIAGPPGGQLVLVVEDDAIFRRFLGTLLQQHGYRTVEARSAESGWVLARRLRPALVVLDYALTCAENANLRTGWDLAERMTTDPKTRHIPLIFVTGFEGELREKLRNTAFARRPEHLMKPVDGSLLVEKIQEMVGAIQGRLVRLLMADDDPSVSAYIRKVLPEDRFHIEMAANGEECLHILRTQPRAFDLLLLDLMMPDVSGYDVLREMTLSGTGAELPVLVLTNFPEPRNEEERRLLEQGLVLDVVPKTSVHDNPQLLPHIIDWHMQVTSEQQAVAPADAPAADEEPRREAA
ncbi:MAG: response regulator [Candidatus Eisenbacteria bacterium]|nr:response regulator [Candidatus Eisenbacteria bacterium]